MGHRYVESSCWLCDVVGDRVIGRLNKYQEGFRKRQRNWGSVIEAAFCPRVSIVVVVFGCCVLVGVVGCCCCSCCCLVLLLLVAVTAAFLKETSSLPVCCVNQDKFHQCQSASHCALNF